MKAEDVDVFIFKDERSDLIDTGCLEIGYGEG